MSIDSKLLWLAYPLGHLPLLLCNGPCNARARRYRGHSTVGGYLYYGNGYWITDAGKLGSPGHASAEIWAHACIPDCLPLNNGHLLPNVDPSDTATWVCLLEDLSEAVWGPQELSNVEHVVGYAWCFGASGDPGVRAWKLLRYMEDCKNIHLFMDIDTDDPAKALVLARIQLREGRRRREELSQANER